MIGWVRVVWLSSCIAALLFVGSVSSAVQPPRLGRHMSPRSAEAARPPARPPVRMGAELRADYPPHTLCDRTDIPDGVLLNAATLDSIGGYFHDFNVAVIAATDSLYGAGAFGEAGSRDAKRAALLHFAIHSWNASKTISDLTEGGLELARVDGDFQMEPFIHQYMNSATYPLRNIERARLGADAYCIRYNIPKKYKEALAHGSVDVKVESKIVKLDGIKTPVISREWIDGNGDKMELFFEDVFCGRVAREIIEDRGDRLELTTFFDMEGLYVHRHGTHHVSAMISWRSVPEDGKILENPRLGAAAYFPRIKVKLPIFLPDVGLDDLRDFAYPPPLMAKEAFAADPSELPEWLEVISTGQFKQWKTAGPRPLILRERFPDL